jgi:4a-hydroxytetrahydrobiopterin dehydratase
MSFKERNNFLEETFEFKDFQSALDFVCKSWVIFEELDHHPDICIFKYKFVKISSTTHSEWNIITQLDHDVAERISNLYEHGI